MRTLKLVVDTQGVIYFNRLIFQMLLVKGSILNIGCETDPSNMGGFGGINLDTKKRNVANFVLADAHYLPFKDKSFTTVLLGDVLEHVWDWRQVIKEAKRVVRNNVIITVPKKGYEEKFDHFHNTAEYYEGYGSALHIHEFTEEDVKELEEIFEGWECFIFDFSDRYWMGYLINFQKFTEG